MKRVAISLLSGAAFAAMAIVPGLAAPPNVTGTWKIEQSGLNGTSTSTVTLTQSGMGIVGKNASNGNGFTGEYINDTQINGKWKGPGGAGWLTVYVSPNGHSLNGTWGYNGRKSNGSFVGNMVLPPSPITAAGMWNVTGAGGPTMFVGKMKCTESGPSVVCHSGPILIQGKFRTKDKVRANFSGPNGASGYFSFWFNGDNNSFNGIWGNGPDTSPVTGRVIGQRALP